MDISQLVSYSGARSDSVEMKTHGTFDWPNVELEKGKTIQTLATPSEPSIDLIH